MSEQPEAPSNLAASWGRLRAAGELLKTRDVRLLWSGQVIAQIGDGVNRVALLWFVYAMTGSALKMTMIGLLQTLPPLVLGPLIGAYLDRLPKKATMIWSDLARAGVVLLIPLLHAMNALTLERLYVLVFVNGVVSTAYGPALASATPLIVPRAQFLAANALIQSTANIGALIGPALSGVGIALLGERHVLYINAATYALSAVCLMPIRVRQDSPRTAPEQSLLGDVITGFRYVFLQRVVLLLMITVACANLAWSGFLFLLPAVAQHVLDMGPLELGWLWSSMGVGMLLASMWLACRRQGETGRQLQMIPASMAVGGLAVCGLRVIGGMSAAAPLVVVIGACIALVTPVVWALLQELSPHDLYGRVFATFSTGAMCAAMSGMMAFGWAADRLGAGPSLLAIGLTLLGAAILTARFSRLIQGAPAMSAIS